MFFLLFFIYLLYRTMPMTDETIDLASLGEAMDYAAYCALLGQLMAEGKTTGNDQSESMVAYAKNNIKRMNEREQIDLSEKTKRVARSVNKPVLLLLLAEGWCGDVAQNLPTIAKIAAQNPDFISLRILLRDENLPIMDMYLTNGARAIPKMVVLRNDDMQEIGVWGPRPTAAQDLLLKLKQEQMPMKEIYAHINNWYEDDQTHTLQAEMVDLLCKV